ncbi:iron chelate uptake ABC transporter family permease subunit [Sanguibacter sp. 25GB23B1]|uniref:iron chelate uptake ABC transporter family permease subunit n=1 Tax=unclassified Sanguibacter TaxID=2645534 RepID=UPI0032AEB027
MASTTVATTPSGVAHNNATRSLWLLVLVGALALALLLSLAVGAKTVPFTNVLSALFAPDGSTDDVVVREMRAPRTVLGLLVGIALGLSGAMIQALTRNPLADPGILGVNAGAGFAVVVGVAVFGVVEIEEYIWFAFLGVIVTTVVVYVIGSMGRGGTTPVRLTLAGIAIGAVLGGVSSGITLLDPQVFDAMRYWGAGSLSNRTWEMVGTVTPFILAGTAVVLLVARPLNAVALGDDLASSLGANLGRTRAWVVVGVTLLCGAATAAAGPIGFVGLMVPHVARWFVGPDQRWIMPYTLAMAPVLLLVSDVIGRVVLRPAELQVGIVTAFVGAPVLIWLVRRRKVSGL